MLPTRRGLLTKARKADAIARQRQAGHPGRQRTLRPEAVASFRPRCLLEIQRTLAAKNISRAYVNKTVGIIKRMFKWGVAEELVPPAVHTALSTVEGLMHLFFPPPIPAIRLLSGKTVSGSAGEQPDKG